jgi:hypothetical protein
VSAPGGIPPYGEQDHRAALKALGIDDGRTADVQTVREVAGAIATARIEGVLRALKLVTRAVELAPWGVGDPLTIRDELLRALAPDAEAPPL